jgi:hypothetical protein
MNTKTQRILSAVTSIASCAAVGVTADTASAQAAYDRQVRSREMSFTPSPLPGAFDVFVRVRLYNHTASTLPLGFSCTLAVNGIDHGPLFFTNNMPGQLGYSCEGGCGGDCNALGGAVCSAQDGGGCACGMIMDFVVPGPFVFAAGDVVTARLAAGPGSLPEIDTSDDAAAMVFGAGCPADLNGDGRIDVRDYLAFLSLYATASPLADFTGNGHIDVSDFLAFLAAYAHGC